MNWRAKITVAAGVLLLAGCRELPRYKRPRRVIFAKVPRNPTGKIEKPVLRQIYCGGRLVEEQTKA